MNMSEIIAGVLIILFSAAPVQAQEQEGKEKDTMNEYTVKPAATADMEKLIQALSTGKVPHQVVRTKDEIVVTIGPDGEYDVRSVSNWLKIKKVNVQIKYEHPAFKYVVMDWMDQCGVDTQEDFYKWHMRLSPGLLKDIQTQWHVDLSSLPVTPIKLGKYVFVLTATNITAQLAEQLKVIPHRTLLKEEYIKSDEFEVKGDDPLDMVVYGWKSEDGSQLFVVTARAPVMTMVTLWVIPPGAPVEVKMGEVNGAEAVADSEVNKEGEKQESHLRDMANSVVYDKAKYHYDGKFPKDLPVEQAFVHTAMFLGWIIDANLHSQELQNESAQQINLFRQRKLSPVKIYEWWDGVLLDEMLSAEGNQFAQYYFDFTTGKFLTDYEELLCADLPSMYHVKDTWDNYYKLKQRIDSRYEEWKSLTKSGTRRRNPNSN